MRSQSYNDQYKSEQLKAQYDWERKWRMGLDITILILICTEKKTLSTHWTNLHMVWFPRWVTKPGLSSKIKIRV